MEQYPKLKLAPAVTYDREDGTSVKLGASLRLSWPERARERIADEATNRERARALYLEKLHDLRAEAHGANARLTRAMTDLVALDQGRAASAAALAEGTARHLAGDLDLSRYLLLAEYCEDLERTWLAAAEDYRLAAIGLDHATGRLNRSRESLPEP
jgi:outer membrane protein TolC